MDSEVLNKVFQTAKAETFALFNKASKCNEEAVERNITPRFLETWRHYLRLEEVSAEKLSSIRTEEYVTNTLAANAVQNGGCPEKKSSRIAVRSYKGVTGQHFQ